MFRVDLGRKHKQTMPPMFTTSNDDDEVRMTFGNYRAIFAAYFASLGAVSVTIVLEKIWALIKRGSI